VLLYFERTICFLSGDSGISVFMDTFLGELILLIFLVPCLDVAPFLVQVVISINGNLHSRAFVFKCFS